MASYKVDSPYAKFSSTGSLTCTLCQCPVKGAKVWTAHVNGRMHRMKLLELKKQASSAYDRGKRKLETDEVVEEKKTKLDDDDSGDLLSEPDIGIEERDVLPADFFAASTNALPVHQQSAVIEEEPKLEPKPLEREVSKSVPDALPEGFFDDPLQDAKARSVEYKDPLDEEWKKFQKEIEVEEHVAEEVLEEDLELMNLERSLEEIDEEMRGWSVVNAWEKKIEELAKNTRRSEAPLVKSESLSDFEDDGTDVDAIMDWRSKGYA